MHTPPPAALPFASRRDFLARSWNGRGSLAVTGLAAQEARSDGDLPNPLAGQSPHIPRRAKHCIFLFMQGGVTVSYTHLTLPTKA